MVALMAHTYLLNDFLKTRKITFVISSISPSTFRLYVIVKGTSWMLSANDLDLYMMPKCLQILAITTK